MTTLFGLPAHALLNHTIVVLVPLLALLEILCAIWPAARRRLVWLNLAFAVAVMVLTPLTTSAGEWLYNRESEHAPFCKHTSTVLMGDLHCHRVADSGRRPGYSALVGVAVGGAQAGARGGRRRTGNCGRSWVDCRRGSDR